MTDNRGRLASGGSGGCLAPARRTARAVVNTVALHATAVQVNGATVGSITHGARDWVEDSPPTDARWSPRALA